LDRRNFLRLPLAAGAAILATGAIGAQPASAVVAPLPKAVALKGFGYGKGVGQLGRLLSLNTQWNYGWAGKYPLTPINYVPMVRDTDYFEKNLLNIKNQLSITKSENLLGFNEPDLASQANMSVDEAIRLWGKLEELGLRLGSPATIKPNAEWMDSFMTKAKKARLRIDFATMHCYQWPDTADFLRKLDMLHEKWGLPVWVTEYAVADFSATTLANNRYSRTDVNRYMKETVQAMREREWVERFAWKTRASSDPKMGTSALFDHRGWRTSTGKLYASL
jgi:hypothetical protein